MLRNDPDGLSPDDVAILDVESAAVTGLTLKMAVLQPAPQPVDVEWVRNRVLEAAGAPTARYATVDDGAGAPRWVTATDFDIRAHVRADPPLRCATPEDLWRNVGRLMSQHLDRTSPLWTFDLLGPLEDGRQVIAARLHHAMADGIAALRFLDALLFDDRVVDSPLPLAGPRPTEPNIVIDGRWRLPSAVLRELGRPGSASPFDRPITVARELAFTQTSIVEMKAVAASRPRPATVNDVLLTIVAGGLRTWLSNHDTLRRRLRAQIPVSLHHRDEDEAVLGNRDSFFNVGLSVQEADPLIRLDRISAETRRRKRLRDADELYEFFHALGRVNGAERVARRLAGSAREFSVSISNVPGPRTPVAVAGRRVQQLFSSSEPGAHHALRISAISCADEFGIALCVDPGAVPHVAPLAEAIARSYRELVHAAGAG